MRKFYTLTLLSVLLLTLVSSPSAQQRVANVVRDEKRVDQAKKDAEFTRISQETSKLTSRLGADRDYSNRFLETARAHDRATLEKLVREAGVRSPLKLDVKNSGGQSTDFTISICIGALVTICFEFEV